MSGSHKEAERQLTADDQLAKIFEWRRGFNAMHLIDIGIQLGIFKAFADARKATATEIAEVLGLHSPYVNTWCITAYSLGLLEGDEDRKFQLAPFIDEVLANPGHPRFLGGYVRLGTEFATEDHRFCLEAFRSGSTVPFQGRSEAFAEVVADAAAGLQALSTRKLLPELPGLKVKLDEGGTVLEVGCGTGRLLLQLTRAFPNARCIGVDIDPTSMRAARKAIDQAGVSERVDLVEGDISSAIDESTADVVVMIEVLHEISPGIRQQVIQDCYRALRDDGWLLIIDETYPTTIAEARQAEFLFPIQIGFEELTWGNIIPTREEQEMLLRTAGFTGEIGRSMAGAGFTVLSIRK